MREKHAQTSPSEVCTFAVSVTTVQRRTMEAHSSANVQKRAPQKHNAGLFHRPENEPTQKNNLAQGIKGED